MRLMLFPLAKVTVHVVSLRWWGVGTVRGVPLVVVAKHRFSTILDMDRHLFWSASGSVGGDFSY